MENSAAAPKASPANAAGSHRVCPWWLGYLLVSPVRRLLYPPAKVLDAHIRSSMTVLEPGPGMGFFTLEIARRVGESGRVVAVDIQAKMLERLRSRAARAGLLERVDARLAPPNSLCLADLGGRVDFTLVFAVVHEIPSPAAFFREVATASKPGARLLFCEPRGHVSSSMFEGELQAARDAGFTVIGSPLVARSHAALLEKSA